MNSDMMEALENIEREKGISIEIMLEALANALLTAYKRMPDAAEEALVEIDMETGAIKVIAQELDEEGNVTREWDDTPTDFGRIAAQTAKQVIFQRIREAEREMKYEEYAGREGDIVTGIIQQTDARYTLLDLGKVEALLPQAEQVQNEHYDHGSRLKAYIVEVRKTAKGPQIVVSRTHPGSREAAVRARGPRDRRRRRRAQGHRARAGPPHEDRGGVERQQRRPGRRVRRRARGSRVRMVVNELRGEKVDIVPYNDDPAEFVMKALAPARVREVRIHPDTGTAEVIVPDFQLSLAIGKEGQNARLAARLSGWRVDIKSETQLAGRGVGRRRRVRRGRVGHHRLRRARVAARRGRRDDLGRRGRVRGAGGRRRCARRSRPEARARTTPRSADAPAEPAAEAAAARRPPAEAPPEAATEAPVTTEPRPATGDRAVGGPRRTCVGCRADRVADASSCASAAAGDDLVVGAGSWPWRLALRRAPGSVPRPRAEAGRTGPGAALGASRRRDRAATRETGGLTGRRRDRRAIRDGTTTRRRQRQREQRKRRTPLATKKIRVYELARELGVENQVVLDLAERLKIGVKSHSSSIDDPSADRVRRLADSEGLRQERPSSSRAGARARRRPGAPRPGALLRPVGSTPGGAVARTGSRARPRARCRVPRCWRPPPRRPPSP